jgi:hypothetical protein
MNVSVKPQTTSQLLLDGLLGLGFKLLAMSIDNARTMIQQVSSILPPLPDIQALRPKDMCAIPETECPPRCVCEVAWEGSPGEMPGLTVRVTNASKSARTFNLHATPFIGAGGSAGTMTLAPQSLSLSAGASGAVNATFTIPNVPEGEYDAEIVVQGAYEQCVRVILKVQCAKTSGKERGLCEVVQGDPPIRMRAHHWYDHFQCTEPCVQAGHRPDTDRRSDNG